MKNHPWLLSLLFLIFLISNTPANASILNCFGLFEKKVTSQKNIELWLNKPDTPLRYSQLGMEWEGQIPWEKSGDHFVKSFEIMLLNSGYAKSQVFKQEVKAEPEIWLSQKNRKRKFWFPYEEFPTDKDFEAVEVAFPVVFRKPQLSVNYNSLDHLVSIGAKPTIHSGIHFHFDAGYIRNIDVVILAKIFDHLRTEIYQRWGIHSERNHHIGNFESWHFKALLKDPYKNSFEELPSFFDHLFPSYFIRLNPYLNTFEVRLFDSHLDRKILKEQIIMSKLIYDGVINRDNWLYLLMLDKKNLTIDNILSKEHLMSFPKK
jgi:hypothetical protein